VQSPPTTPKPKTSRNFFWLSFAIGFVLLSAISCGSVAMLVGLGDIFLADLQSTGPVWTPPPLPTTLPDDMTVPAPLPATDSSTPEPGRLQPNSQARNAANSRVNIRRTPGYLGKGDNDIVAQMEPDATVTILEWPQSADQLTWWRIRHDSPAGSVEGWVAESTASGVQILAPE
jgi:hypothetical protein